MKKRSYYITKRVVQQNWCYITQKNWSVFFDLCNLVDGCLSPILKLMLVFTFYLYHIRFIVIIWLSFLFSTFLGMNSTINYAVGTWVRQTSSKMWETPKQSNQWRHHNHWLIIVEARSMAGQVAVLLLLWLFFRLAVLTLAKSVFTKLCLFANHSWYLLLFFTHAWPTFIKRFSNCT